MWRSSILFLLRQYVFSYPADIIYTVEGEKWASIRTQQFLNQSIQGKQPERQSNVVNFDQLGGHFEISTNM